LRPVLERVHLPDEWVEEQSACVCLLLEQVFSMQELGIDSLLLPQVRPTFDRQVRSKIARLGEITAPRSHRRWLLLSRGALHGTVHLTVFLARRAD